jgi:hypothetical protein
MTNKSTHASEKSVGSRDKNNNNRERDTIAPSNLNSQQFKLKENQAGLSQENPKNEITTLTRNKECLPVKTRQLPGAGAKIKSGETCTRPR